MILADTFQLTNEQKLAFATLAFQAEYGVIGGNERLPMDFLIEHYASTDLVNQVGWRGSRKEHSSSHLDLLLQFGIDRLRQEILQRQAFYAELNDVHGERMFVENVMKLGENHFLRIGSEQQMTISYD